jgi:hypothetical protein
MILSVEHSELKSVRDSLKEKLRYIPIASYLEYCVRSALGHVEMAILDMRNYENQINFVENRKDPTVNIVAK